MGVIGGPVFIWSSLSVALLNRDSLRSFSLIRKLPPLKRRINISGNINGISTASNRKRAGERSLGPMQNDWFDTAWVDYAS